jgi:16S rRNA (cytosine1402-N4)-methyltransferase
VSEEIYGRHTSVLLNECFEYLKPTIEKSSYQMIDLTFGGGGHSFYFLKNIPNLKLLAVDQDAEAIENGKKNVIALGLQDRVEFFHGNYADYVDSDNRKTEVDIVLADIGVSSHHFDTNERGFSFRGDGPLDMRMDKRKSLTAREVVNRYPKDKLVHVLKEYGEEQLAERIASVIVEERKSKEIESTKELENICFHAYPAKWRHGRTHPATKTFQAIRIEVNSELEVLENSLQKYYGILSEKGKMGIITFHSLEDRIVKHKFKEFEVNPEMKCAILTKKPVGPSDDEMRLNSRSRSAKLRVVMKDSDKQGKVKKKWQKQSDHL